MDNKEFTVSEVIDRIGISGHTWIMFVLLAFAMIFDGYDFMIVNSTNTYTGPTFLANVALGDAAIPVGGPGYSVQLGSLTTWGLLGMVLGGAIGGMISDRIGRKKMLVIAVLFYGIFTLPQAFAMNVPFFAAFRLIAGFGVGSCIPIVTTCFSECIPSKNRGVFVTFGMAFMVAGWVLAGLIAAPICSAPDPIIPGLCDPITYTTAANPDTPITIATNWRLCYLIGALPIVYGLVLIAAMHETPHWYANAGYKDKACQALQRIEQATTHHAAHEYDPNLLVVPPKPESVTPNVLFSNRFIVATCAIWSTYFVGQFCVYGMNAWIPTWFVGLGYSQSDSVALQTWNNVAAIASNISVGFVSDRVGRKRNLIFSWIFCIVAIIICSVFVAPGNIGLCVALMLLFGFALNYAITAVQPLMPESYPTAIRNTGTAWCQAFARFGGSGSSIVLGGIAAMAMFQNADGGTNWSTVVLVLIVPFVLALICSIMFVRESAGQTMESLSERGSDIAQDSGMGKFILMLIIIAILFILCIVLPLCIPTFSAEPYALPLMATGVILPFVFFFIFGGMQLARDKQNRETA